MSKKILRIKKSSHKQHMFADLWQNCPPEQPYEFFINSALTTIGENFGDLLNSFDEIMTQIIVDIATTAANAALEAAQVSNEWEDMAEQRKATPAQPHQKAIEPCWHYDEISNPISLAQSMTWYYSEQQFPHLLCACRTDKQRDDLIGAIDAMIAFALTLVGADKQWDKLYAETKQKMGGGK